MCSFLFTDKDINDLDHVNHFMKFRGPDLTKTIEINEYTFIHNILSITGTFSEQPFVNHDDQIVCIYNGEIYNYLEFGEYNSDGECLIPLYKKYGDKFVKELDGEFAIVLVDFKNNKIIISTDVFSTKPLWFSIGDQLAVATYESAVKALGFRKATKLDANTTQVFDLETRKLLQEFCVYEFDLIQHKTDFSDWIISFENSIRKRTSNLRENIFIGLSSGYDSGGIACELNKQNVPYKAYTVVGSENKEILDKRFSMFNENCSGQYLEDNRWQYRDYINRNVEEFKYRIYSSSNDYNEFDRRLQDDNGSCGLSMICDNAKREGKKVYLSGSGSDEIFSDYGFNGEKKFLHSNFGGLFPEDLTTIFPWASFYGSTMVSYLAKEEYVAGSYGIETRYPYLDTYVVQEFLWLNCNLKNLKYKSVLDEYLTKSNYPFEKNIKRGF
jgi:asparagine synthetase B (glutamine-hydrolysing)